MLPLRILPLTLAAVSLLLTPAPAIPPPAPQTLFFLAPDGDDRTGDGSSERPWRTLRHATDTVPDRGATILLRDGLYVASHSINRRFERPLTVRAENPYRTRLRSPDDSNRALSIYRGRNISLQGLEIFGSGATRGDYLVHISTPDTERIELVDCIIHDSYCNDLIKINNFATSIVLRGCLLFNQNDHEGDEHLDINTTTDVIVEDSILFSDYAGSGREPLYRAHSFVVIKNSGSTPDATRRITLRRNVFLHYQGKVDQCYLLLGEDGKPFYEAQQVLVENNLFLHHSPVRFWGTLLLKGGLRDLVFRANTIVGHPHVRYSGAYAAVFLRIGANPPMRDLHFANNIWSDPSGRMPRFSISRGDTFAAGGLPVLHNNLYHNAGAAIPAEPHDEMIPDRDPQAIFGDPCLGNPNEELILPRWNSARGSFLSGEATIRGEFERLVGLYATPGAGSAARGRADASAMPQDDILGRPRPPRPSIGAAEPVGPG